MSKIRLTERGDNMTIQEYEERVEYDVEHGFA